MTNNNAYTDGQFIEITALKGTASPWELCGCRPKVRCEHARAVEDAARTFVAILGAQPAPHGLTDEQVGAVDSAHACLLERHWEVAESLENVFPEVFADQPGHPWDEVDLKTGEVVAYKMGGHAATIVVGATRSAKQWREFWTDNSHNITDWQVLRPTWTDEEK